MIILDANALVKLVIKEESSLKAEKEIEKAIENGEVLASPEIALAEALNAVWKHFSLVKDINRTELNDSTEKLLFIWNRITKLETQTLAQKAIGIAAENHLNAYDSLYVAACKSNNAPLLTFDSDIIKRAGDLDVKLL